MLVTSVNAISVVVHVTTGGVVSLTVTKAVQLDTLPAVSVTVIVIDTEGISEQLNELWLNPNVANEILQLSLLLLLTSFVDVFPIPEASSVTVTSLHTATGAVVSVTVIVLEHVPVLPRPSVTVAVTVCVPRSVHVNEILLNTGTIPVVQLSHELNTIAVGLTVPIPLPSSVTVTAEVVQVTMGFIVSLTVTTDVQLWLNPPVSVTVIVIDTEGISAQPNVLRLNPQTAIAQLSPLPSSTEFVVVLIAPAASRVTVISLHRATGASGSDITTVEVHVALLLFASVTVSVTDCDTSPHINDVLLNTNVRLFETVQLSQDPLFTAAVTSVPTPPVNVTVTVLLHKATGTVVSLTVTLTAHADELPAASVIVNVTTCVLPIDEQSNVIVDVAL